MQNFRYRNIKLRHESIRVYLFMKPVEITQSGSAIRNYGLTITETVVDSETGIYINPELKNNAEKLDLLKMFLLNLYGVVNAENKVMILFNVPNNNVKKVEKY